MKNNIFKTIAITAILLVAILASFGSGMYLSNRSGVIKELAKKEVVYLGKLSGQYSEPEKNNLAKDVDFKLFWQVWDALKKNYVDQKSLEDKKLFYGALRGMVGAAGDPYTVFMDPVIAQDFSDDLAGTFEGIGAEIGIKKDALMVIAPLPDMPAEKAGIMAGDRIIAIDGKASQGLSVDEAVNKIRGPKGTSVTLLIFREGFDAPKEYKLLRSKIIVKSVRTELRKDNIFVITIRSFNDDTLGLFDKAASEAALKNPAGIILDLRNNPGGYLDTAVEMASEWIEEGPVVIEKFSDTEKNDYLARGRARLKNFKTAVLINQGSASASEIVAGALQDAKKGKVIGEKSFGKGSVQTLENFSDGSSLKVTVAKWLTPLGKSINEEGITPDVPVAFTNDDYNADRDPQIDAAVKWISGKLSEKDILKLKELSVASSTEAIATTSLDKK
jgi:carboxyl-terminal processing protease